MVTAADRPCYLCARKPDRVQVAYLERSATDKTACCARCAEDLGYEIHEDGHLTRKSATS
jgi:hypothetical protein